MLVVQTECNDILTELESWYASERGRRLLELTGAVTRELLATSFGYHILQLGVAGEQPLYDQSPINHRLYCAERPGEGINLIAHPDELPLDSDSVDTVIVHHCLEFARNPHQVLREVQRVLTPQGRLLVIGFNPNSLLGMYARLRSLMGDNLWQHQYPVSERRLTDWLHLLGCEVLEVRRLFSLPPFGSGRLRDWSLRADDWARRHNLPVGGVYLLYATKQVAGANALRPQWRRHRGRLIGLVTKPAPSPSQAGPIAQRYKLLKDGHVAA